LKPIKAYQSVFFTILNIVLAIGTLGFIIYKLVYVYSIGELWAKVQLNYTTETILALLFAILLMPVNWHFETSKWRIIIQKHEPVNRIQSYKSILTGITLGIITPNQVGDLVGKSLYLKNFSKVKGAVAIFLGEVAQTFATVIIGSYGCLMLYLHLIPGSSSLPGLSFVALSIVNVLLIVVFLNIDQLQKIKRWTKLSPYLNIATNYTKPELAQLLLYSGIRFIIFSFQYFLLLYFCGIQLTLPQWAMSIFSIYIIQSFVPSFILLQIGVRGALALYFIGMFSDNTVAILLSAYGLWIINMMLPGLIGLYFLITHKWSSNS
jgi:hypothetical protein